MRDYAVPVKWRDQARMIGRMLRQVDATSEDRDWAWRTFDIQGCAAALNYIEALRRAKEARGE